MISPLGYEGGKPEVHGVKKVKKTVHMVCECPLSCLVTSSTLVCSPNIVSIVEMVSSQLIKIPWQTHHIGN